MANQREKVTFQTNVPVEVVLSYAEGKVMNGQYGDSLMYSLENDRVMFVPPIVGDRIGALGVDAGDALIITKAETQTGTRKRIEWKVVRAEGAGESSDASPAPTRPSPERTQTPQTTTVGRIAFPPQPTAPVAPTPGPLSLPRNYVPPLAAAAATPGDQLGDLLETCLVDAMVASMRAEKAGQAIGCTLRFTSEDVRCISATLFIARSKGGAR